MKSLPDSSSHISAVARATAIAAVVVVGVVAAWMVLPLLPETSIFARLTQTSVRDWAGIIPLNPYGGDDAITFDAPVVGEPFPSGEPPHGTCVMYYRVRLDSSPLLQSGLDCVCYEGER